MAVELDYHGSAADDEIRRRDGRIIMLLGVMALVFVGAGLLFGDAVLLVGMLLGLVLTIMGIVAGIRRRHNGMAMAGYGMGAVALVFPFSLIVMDAMERPGHVEMARRNGTIAAISNLTVAVDTFHEDVGRYPTTAEGLEALLHAPAGLEAKWKGPYIEDRAVPLDKWGREFIYRMPGKKDAKDYDVISAGADGREGTGDDLDKGSL